MDRWKQYFNETLDRKGDIQMMEAEVIYQGLELQVEPPTKTKYRKL
jgi:hypothetical protein